MGTEVLRPQDCLIQRVRVAPAVFHHRRKNYTGNGNQKANNNINNCRKPQLRSDQRRRSPEPVGTKRSASTGDLRSKSHHNQLVLGQVTILRRGESLDSKSQKNGGEMIVCGTERLGPAPEMVPKQIRISPVASAVDTYAGSAFYLSPSPRALPLPSFFNKKQNPNTVDDSATKDLRRLLRLE